MCSLRVVNSDGDMASPSRARHKVLGIKYVFQAHFDIGPAMLHSSIIVSILIFCINAEQNKLIKYTQWLVCAVLNTHTRSYTYVYIFEGSLEVKLPTRWTDEKQRWEESEKRRENERGSKRESLRRKKIQVRKKVGKSRNTVFF